MPITRVNSLSLLDIGIVEQPKYHSESYEHREMLPGLSVYVRPENEVNRGASSTSQGPNLQADNSEANKTNDYYQGKADI
jgi:hypothetical protein